MLLAHFAEYILNSPHTFCKVVNMLRYFALQLLSRNVTRTERYKHCFLQYSSGKQESFQVMVKEFGNPNEVLEGVTVEIPKIAPHQMLVKLLMSPINPSDINMIEGTYHIRPELPAVAGNEGVGEVLEVGSDLKDYSPGERIIYSVAARSSCSFGAGTWRQFAILEPSNVISVPKDMPVIGAATLAVNPCTAYRLLKDFVKLDPGDFLIQNGANSAVGQCVIQLAKHWGIRTINIIRDRPDKDALINHLKILGADIVLTGDKESRGELKEMMKITTNRPRLALNCVGGESSAHLVTNLRRGGVLVTYGGMSRRPVMIPTGPTIFNQIKAFGYWNTAWMIENIKSEEKHKMFQELCNFIIKGILKTPEADLFLISDYKTAVSESTKEFKEKKKILVMDESLF